VGEKGPMGCINCIAIGLVAVDDDDHFNKHNKNHNNTIVLSVVVVPLLADIGSVNVTVWNCGCVVI